MILQQQFNPAVDIQSIEPHPARARIGHAASIIESMQANGFFGVLICQKETRYILVGSEVWAAAFTMGMTHVPVVWLEVDDQVAIRIMLAANGCSDRAVYDWQKLQDLWARIPNLLGTGWDEETARRVQTHNRTRQLPPEYDDVFDAEIVEVDIKELPGQGA